MNFIKKLTQKQIRMIVFGIIIILSAIIFEEVVDDIFSDPSIGDTETLIFDKAALKALQNFRGPELNQSMIDITALGSFSVITLFTTIIVIFLIVHKDWRGLAYIVCIAAGAAIIPSALKDYFMRERPDALGQLANVKSTSFPSGHSFGATVAYFSLAFLLSRELKELKLEGLYYTLAVLVVGLVGTSRMYLGVHYPTDIVGGVCTGLIWFSLVSLPFVYYSRNSDAV
jgi:undecaprenyl-diphosphatase